MQSRRQCEVTHFCFFFSIQIGLSINRRCRRNLYFFHSEWIRNFVVSLIFASFTLIWTWLSSSIVALTFGFHSYSDSRKISKSVHRKLLKKNNKRNVLLNFLQFPHRPNTRSIDRSSLCDVHVNAKAINSIHGTAQRKHFEVECWLQLRSWLRQYIVDSILGDLNGSCAVHNIFLFECSRCNSKFNAIASVHCVCQISLLVYCTWKGLGRVWLRQQMSASNRHGVLLAQ